MYNEYMEYENYIKCTEGDSAVLETKRLEVWYEERQVGVLQDMENGHFAFQYETDWIRDGFSLNPLSLPLCERTFLSETGPLLEGMFGVFYDLLSDGWGRMVMDAWIQSCGLDPVGISPLVRLALKNFRRQGALSFRPAFVSENTREPCSVDWLFSVSSSFFRNQGREEARILHPFAGTCSGARPKVFQKMDGQEYLVKFPCALDPEDIARQEYEYMKCAQACGIRVPEFRLLSTPEHHHFFAVKRFDRDGEKRIHMCSASSLLETSHRLPNLDYSILIKLCRILTHNEQDVDQLFRLACFNVFSHNQDDHGQNFAFLYDTDQKDWVLAPAYDLTWSQAFGNEHSTTVMGSGRPGRKELHMLAESAGISRSRAEKIIDSIEHRVQTDLKKWLGR